MEEKIFEIISMSCEHFAVIPIKCTRRLAMEMVDMVKEFTRWFMENEFFYGKLSEEIMTPLLGFPEFKTIDELFNYWYNNIYKK